MHFLFYMQGQYANKVKTFHQYTTTQTRAIICRRYSMDAKDKEGVWRDFNYHNSISFFKIYFKTHGRGCKKPISDVTEAMTKLMVF